METVIYSIGHSTHPLEKFTQLLRQHEIETLADVRSTPYSRRQPQFSRPRLEATLPSLGIDYLFLGEGLGARPQASECYVNSKVNFDLLAKTPAFSSSLQTLIDTARHRRVAMMCAEKEPLDCHRTSLVARHLIAQGITVKHILASGEIESHDITMQRLIGKLKLSAGDLFETQSDLWTRAYEKHADRIAYHLKPAPEK